jgi:adenine C2-methylase RlmN of 23S rRNA A2503 and tRNA A37
MQSQIAHTHQSADGTRKLLVRFDDGASAESVLML